jgi:hypothetical protein
MDNNKYFGVFKVTDENARCNRDMGMTDFGIDDFQIYVSSSLKEFPAVNARPLQSSWCSSIDDPLPFIQVIYGFLYL